MSKRTQRSSRIRKGVYPVVILGILIWVHCYFRQQFSLIRVEQQLEDASSISDVERLRRGITPLRVGVNSSGRWRVWPLFPFGSSGSQDPCAGRAGSETVGKALGDGPPSVFFLHVPKTAGTLLFSLLMEYAKRTFGVACSILIDGGVARGEMYQVDHDTLMHKRSFPQGSNEAELISAFLAKNNPYKKRLFERGACRIIRGHFTFGLYEEIGSENKPLLVSIMRDPIERFVSMYEFVRSMVKDRPGVTGWDGWLQKSLSEELGNGTSILNRGFYDERGNWLRAGNVGFSFHFYGVLHQLSGMKPRFIGVGNPLLFDVQNGEEMVEKAKENLCRVHVLGLQEDMNTTLEFLFDYVQPFAKWNRDELRSMFQLKRNLNTKRESRDVSFHLPDAVLKELQKRLRFEIEVYEFAKRLFAYRAAQRGKEGRLERAKL